jgi:hypothetical protein
MEKKKPFNLELKGFYNFLNVFCGELGFRTYALYALLMLFLAIFSKLLYE